jgi:CheY-like chemotaxis protein
MVAVPEGSGGARTRTEYYANSPTPYPALRSRCWSGGKVVAQRTALRQQRMKMIDMSERIIIVEDEPAVAGFLGDLLTSEGYGVEWHTDGHSGLEAILENPPDVVLLDVMLPRMDGRDVLAALRSAKLTRCLPVIVMSALDLKRALSPDLRNNPRTWLYAKGEDLEVLLSLLDTALRGNRNAHQFSS